MNRRSVFDQVRGRWPALLAQLGVDPSFLSGKHGPCPMCGGKDRWRFDDKKGMGTWICTQCGAGGPLGLLERLFGWPPAEAARRLEQLMDGVAKAPKQAIRPPPDPVAQARAMRVKYFSARRIGAAGPVWRYLRSRGISYDPSVNLREKVYSGRVEMLAMVQTHHGQPCQVHRTLITQNPYEVQRLLMPGPHPAGSSVRLMPWQQGQQLGVAEGIETALSASQCYGIPVWAALNAGRLKCFRPPDGCTDLVIFADNDLNDVGRHAAVELAHRVSRRCIGADGINVMILMPTKSECDYNDVLLETRSGDALGKIGNVQ